MSGADACPEGHFAPRAHLWAALTRAEIARAQAEGALVVIPTGATEQHGDHLATGTDGVLARAVSELAAARVAAPRVLVAPALTLGFSPHHLDWPGTLSLRLETYLALLRDTAVSVLDNGFPRAVFVNGHGGNSAPLRALCGELITDGHAIGMVDYFAPGQPAWSDILAGALRIAGHACEYETALTLALASEAERSRVKRAVAGLSPRLAQPWMVGDGGGGGAADPSRPDPISAHGAGWAPIFDARDCGYWGDPAAATPDIGAAALEATVAGLARFLADFAAAPLRVGPTGGGRATRA